MENRWAVEKICEKGEFWASNGTVNVWWRVRVSGEQVAGELESVTSLAQGVFCKAGEMRQEVDSRNNTDVRMQCLHSL